jgi:hypothetical protein
MAQDNQFVVVYYEILENGSKKLIRIAAPLFFSLEEAVVQWKYELENHLVDLKSYNITEIDFNEFGSSFSFTDTLKENKKFVVVIKNFYIC